MKKINSIAGKVISLVILSMFLAVVIVMWIVIPDVEQNVTDVTENYMVDLARLAGEELDNLKDDRGLEAVLDYELLQEILGDVALDDISSSYTYLVSQDGTMIYHPTAEKIGKQVENDAVKQLVSEIANGNRPEPSLIEYVFKDANKFAAYYISEDSDFIVVVTADESDVLNNARKIIIDAAIGALVALVICTAFAAFIALRIVRPIKVLNQGIKKLADLDFTKSPEVEKFTGLKDECGEISKSVIMLEEQLEEVMQTIKDLVDQVYDASDNMSQSALDSIETVGQVECATNEIATGATSQAEETQLATENVISMGNMIVDTTNEVEDLRNHSNNMDAAGDEALKILSQLSAINDKTRESVELVSEQTNITNECVTDIKTAVEMITEIASETNLLSLNASIEAARAGEAGRGFAVVAAEIQKLAEQSNTSAKQIAEIITKITQESEKSVEIMNEIKVVIAQQNEDVLATQEAFKKVKTGIDASMGSIENITDRTLKLDEARVKVVDVVSDLSAIAEENAASSEETLASATEANSIMRRIGDDAQNVHSVAIDLKKCIDRIKI